MWHLDETYQTTAGTVRAGRAGDGKPLVLAHGWPWSSFSWHRLIPALARDYSVHWYDMPGFGRSEMDGPRAPALDVQGEVFGEMLDRWGLYTPLVIAHDFGGAVTLRAHLLHARDYAGWILMNVVAMRPWGSAFFDHVGRHVPAFEGLPPHIHAAVVGAYIDGALTRPLQDDDRAHLIAPWLDAAGQAAFYRQFALADERFTAEIEPQFGNLRSPAAVLWGTEDPWIPLARGGALARAIGVDLLPMEGLGHLPQLESPATVLDTVTPVLERF
ncbi:MAG: alpha/beta hydrolase [Pseudomonadota bacterium]